MKEVKDYYNTFQYPKINLFTNKQKKKHKKLILKILSYGKIFLKDIDQKKILDAGCGTGEKAVFFAKNGGKVIAIDFTENQLKVAKDYAKRVGVDNKIIFKQKDIINSSLKDLEKFDIIICTGVLHHTEDAYKGFLNLVGLLERNGIIIVGLYHKYARWRFRFIRFLLHLFVSKDYKKLDLWFEKNNFFARFLKRAPKNSVYDRYLVPFESYHTLREVKGWFKKNNLKFVENSKNVDGFEIFKIFERKTLFFVSGHKNK